MTGGQSIVRRSARKTDIDRAIKAVKDAGLGVASVKIGHDGSIEVVPAPAPGGETPSSLDTWRARRDAIRAAG